MKTQALDKYLDELHHKIKRKFGKDKIEKKFGKYKNDIKIESNSEKNEIYITLNFTKSKVSTKISKLCKNSEII